MDWHVRYRNDETDHVVTHSTPEKAIEEACELIDLGYDDFGLGTGPLADSIAKDVIAKIYGMWAKEKSPFGGI